MNCLLIVVFLSVLVKISYAADQELILIEKPLEPVKTLDQLLKMYKITSQERSVEERKKNKTPKLSVILDGKDIELVFTRGVQELPTEAVGRGWIQSQYEVPPKPIAWNIIEEKMMIHFITEDKVQFNHDFIIFLDNEKKRKMYQIILETPKPATTKSLNEPISEEPLTRTGKVNLSEDDAKINSECMSNAWIRLKTNEWVNGTQVRTDDPEPNTIIFNYKN